MIWRITTATFKPNPQTRCLVKQTEALQERMLQEFTGIHAEQCTRDAVDGIYAQLEALDVRLTEQAARLDQLQMKVNLSCECNWSGSTRAVVYCAGWEAATGARQQGEFLTSSFRGVWQNIRSNACVDHATVVSDLVPLDTRAWTQY
ncbi:hypothetical protein D1007_08012 [Hordeum vulgare]|nr:hypothetical protein D1007_08012 [Hordeum vulgare]